MNIRKSFLSNTPIAHRGLHDDKIPENSYAAFESCIKAGYAIETDVRFTKDKKVILFHDDNLKRMTGKDKKVCDLTYDEISELKLKDTDEKIPLFSDFLKFVNEKVPILIEIKYVGEIGGLVEKTIELLKDYEGEYAFQSFNPLYVKKAKKLSPNKFCGQLASNGTKEDFSSSPVLWQVKSFMMQRLMFNCISKPDFLSYNVENMPYKKAIRFKDKPDKLLLCWVVRTEEEYKKISPLSDNVIFEYIRPPFKHLSSSAN